VKIAFLANLATHSGVVKTQVASAVAAIAAIEIPRKEWMELIPSLCSNAAHENFDVRLASLQALGFICEELSPEDLSNDLKNSVILALINNISTDASLIKSTELATKALLNALPYASQNF